MGDDAKRRLYDEAFDRRQHEEAMSNPDNALLGKYVIEERRAGRSLRDAILAAYDRVGRPRPNRYVLRALLSQWTTFERSVGRYASVLSSKKNKSKAGAQ